MRLRLLLLLICLVGALTATGPASAVTGGEPDNGAHPYVAALLIPPPPGSTNGPGLCSGALISPFTLVTAAHCFPTGGFPPGVPAGYYPVLATLDDPASTSSSFKLGMAILHPDFETDGSGLPGMATTDVAVVRMLQPFVGVSRVATLPDAGAADALAVRSELTIVGYGTYGFERGGGKPVPQPISGQPKPRLKASVELLPAGAIAETHLKLSSNKGGACTGDSGGPVLDGHTLLAVNSFTSTSMCAAPSYAFRIDRAEIRTFITTAPLFFPYPFPLGPLG